MLLNEQIKKHNMAHGWIIIDKPSGVTSTRVVTIVRKALGVKKIGHAGTLDPMASGVLPLAIGEATKTVSFAVDYTKQYIFTVEWGAETDTLDKDGEITFSGGEIPSLDEIKSVLPGFIGKIEQIPPQYSALKVNGKRAYAIARKGVSFELAARKVQIDSLEIISSNKNNTSFSVTCGKGTYVRSLARDIAYKLGTKCYLTSLRRTRVGKFFEDSTILLEDINKMLYKEVFKGFLPVETVLDDIPVLDCTEGQAFDLKFGRKVKIFTDLPALCLVQVFSSGILIALAEISEKFVGTGESYVQPVRVFNF